MPDHASPESLRSFGDAGNAVFPAPGSVLRSERPETEARLAALLREASAAGTPVTFAAARTGLAGAAVPLESGLVIDTSGLNRLPDRPGHRRAAPFLLLSESDPHRAIVAPGTPLRDLNAALEPLGLWYPPHPGETRALIGGNVATNASGPRTFAFGATRAYVESLRVALIDGDFLELRRGRDFAAGREFSLRTEGGRTLFGTLPDYEAPKVKNAAGIFAAPGMDPIDLFVGSEGIFGCFTEIGLRLLPFRAIRPRLFFLPSAAAALDLADALRPLKADARRYAENPRADGLGILSLEFLDGNALRLAREAGRAVPAASGAAIEVETFAGDEATDARVAALAAAGGSAETLAGSAAEEFRYSVPRRVAELLKELGRPKLGTDFAVPESAFREMFRAYEEAEAECGGEDARNEIRTAKWGHVGDCHLHCNFLPRTDADARRAGAAYLRLVRKAVSLGGTLSAEHGAGKKLLPDETGAPRPYLSYLWGDKLRQIADVKKIFDPAGLLNRGDMVPVSML